MMRARWRGSITTRSRMTAISRADSISGGGGAAGGGHGLDLVDVGTIDAVEEHPRVARERFDVPPLPLGEQRVEGQRRLAGAGHARDDGEAIVGNLERDVLQVVLPGSLDP